MKRTLSVVTAAMLAGALALPAVAQVSGSIDVKAGTSITAPSGAVGSAVSGAVNTAENTANKAEEKAEKAANKAEEKTEKAAGKAEEKTEKTTVTAKTKGHKKGKHLKVNVGAGASVGGEGNETH